MEFGVCLLGPVLLFQSTGSVLANCCSAAVAAGRGLRAYDSKVRSLEIVDPSAALDPKPKSAAMASAPGIRRSA